MEHAIAVLIGQPPADFTIAPGALDAAAGRRSRPACPRPCCSAAPTSPRPSARRPPPAPDRRRHRRLLSRTSRSPARAARRRQSIGALFSPQTLLLERRRLGGRDHLQRRPDPRPGAGGARRLRPGRGQLPPDGADAPSARSRTTSPPSACWPKSSRSCRPRSTAADQDAAHPARTSTRPARSTTPASWSPRPRTTPPTTPSWQLEANRLTTTVDLIVALGGGWNADELNDKGTPSTGIFP